MKTKKYGKNTNETEIKLRCSAIQSEDAFMNIKRLNIKFMSKFDDDYWVFTTRHNIKYLDKIKSIKMIKELIKFKDKQMGIKADLKRCWNSNNNFLKGA